MEDEDDVENRIAGIALRCLAATAFAGMAAMMKVANAHGATVVEMIFYRSVGALPLVALWTLPRGGRAAIATRRPLVHLTRSMIGLAGMVLTFGALALLPLAQATTLTYSAPLIATMLSALLLGEAVGARRWGAVAAGFAGLLVVAHPFDEHVPLAGIAVGLGAAVAQALVMITLRQIGRTERTGAIVFWFTITTGLVSATLLPWFGRAHAAGDLTLLLGGGLLAGIAQLAMTGSLRFAPVSVVVPFDYLQILWAMLIGWAWLGDVPAATTLDGAALIAASGIYTAWRERRRGVRPALAEAMPEG